MRGSVAKRLRKAAERIPLMLSKQERTKLETWRLQGLDILTEKEILDKRRKRFYRDMKKRHAGQHRAYKVGHER